MGTRLRPRGRVVRTPDSESEILGSSLALTTCWICGTVIPSFNSFTAPVNSQMVILLPVGILNKLMFYLNRFFLYLQCPQLAQQC